MTKEYTLKLSEEELSAVKKAIETEWTIYGDAAHLPVYDERIAALKRVWKKITKIEC